MIYRLQLSTKDTVIRINQEEFEKFKKNISANFIEFKNGIVNPSFVVCCVIDHEASEQESRELKWARDKQGLLDRPKPTPEDIQKVKEIREGLNRKFNTKFKT